MHALAISSLVWAQTRPINFDLGPKPLNTSMLLAIVGVGVGILVIVTVGLLVRMVLLREKKTVNHAGKLFAELCKAHQLDGGSKRLLQRLASAHTMEPAVLFVDPESFDVSLLGPSWQGQRAQVEELRDTIFCKRVDASPAPAMLQTVSL